MSGPPWWRRLSRKWLVCPPFRASVAVGLVVTSRVWSSDLMGWWYLQHRCLTAASSHPFRALKESTPHLLPSLSCSSISSSFFNPNTKYICSSLGSSSLPSSSNLSTIRSASQSTIALSNSYKQNIMYLDSYLHIHNTTCCASNANF
jgi:hypothetical protein